MLAKGSKHGRLFAALSGTGTFFAFAGIKLIMEGMG